ncbi:unnamed protein product [Bursaphelenchus okinawaensis]|uniref:Chromo domain-containing protein n=1 Tax=Bursaphelenchus okinawaensis TaxID=465554 RepID=A0A811L5E9_9BILA|nr:unnamed protein product [Bursaphelenchus okinawaensis]CAG9117587.1 unnamed protein product [Bursaphelenchus okinawaensis]
MVTYHVNGEVMYEVKKLLDHKVENGQLRYKVLWKDYSDSEATWEGESSLKACSELLKAYKKKHKLDKHGPMKRRGRKPKVAKLASPAKAHEPIATCKASQAQDPSVPTIEGIEFDNKENVRPSFSSAEQVPTCSRKVKDGTSSSPDDDRTCSGTRFKDQSNEDPVLAHFLAYKPEDFKREKVKLFKSVEEALRYLKDI